MSADIPEYGMPLETEIDMCPTKHYAVPVLFTLIATIGIIANSVVIFIITVLKEYEKSVTNVYILQLAIADFIFLFQVFFQARTLLLGRWTYGVTWCKISEAIKMLNYYSSIAFLTVMSVDRYMAINLAMNQKVRKYRTKTAACIISGCTWTIAILSIINILLHAEVSDCECSIQFPNDVDASSHNMSFDGYNFDLNFNETGLPSQSYSENDYDYPLNESDYEYLSDEEIAAHIGHVGCSLQGEHVSPHYRTWIVCNFVLAFILPLIIICVSYALILRRIMKPMAIGSKSKKSNKTRKRVTRMVTGLVSTFIICWLPYHSFNLVRLNDILLTVDACNAIEQFTIVFAYSGSAINPFFYTFLATNFRKRWGSAVGKARRGLRQSILSHSGEYTPGTSFKGRRKSSLSNSTAKHRDDISVNSFVTKNTIVPMNNEIKEDKM